jgi:uncharacterized protein YdeI (YjbR/CyaY-like superfamily)
MSISPSSKTKDQPVEVSIPADLLMELSKNKVVTEYFNSLPPSHRKEYIKWITEAKKEETRKSRIAKTIEQLIEKQRVK